MARNKSPTLAEHAQEQAELDELRATNRRLQAANRRLKASKEELVSAVMQAAYDAALTLGPVKLTKAPAKDTRAHPEIALLHSTDWQTGKRTVSYNMDVAQARVNQMADKVDLMTRIQRADHPVNHCVLALGGDMIEGLTIFPGQAFEVEAFLFEQLFWTANMLEGLIRRLLVTFPKVEVYEEYGNHGRLGRKSGGEFPPSDNVDRMLYEIVRHRFANEKRLLWHSATDFYQLMALGEYRALLVHGDEIHSFGGNTPAYGIIKKVNAWASGVLPAFKDAYMGHFHTAMTLPISNGGRIFVTGSTESDNVYAKEFVAATGQPSQRLHYIDPQKGRVAAEYVLWLD